MTNEGGTQSTDVVILQLKIEETGSKKMPEAKKEVEVLAGSIMGLSKANKALREERNKLDTTSESGRKRIAELNAEINKNNAAIKENSSALEKQRMNVGNYIGALDNLIPGLGATATGFQAATKSALAFIATPIGAVIGAIGLALGALIAYFKGSEEGQNKLNRIMNAGGAIMEKVMDIVENLGGALFEAAENPKKAFQDLVDFITNNLINRFKAVAVIIEGVKNLDFKQIVNGTIQLTTGVTDVIGKLQEFGKEVAVQVDDAMARAKILSDLQEKLNEQERALTVDRAKTQRDVSRLFVESQELEGQARLDKINEAIALEEKLLVKEKNIASTRLAIAKQTVEDDPTIENKQAYAEAVAAQYQAEQAFFDGVRRLDRQRISAQEEVQKQRLQLYEDFLARQHELYLKEKADRDEAEKQEDAIIDRFESRLARETKARREAQKKQADDTKKLNEEKIKSEQMYQDAIADMLGQAAGLFRKNTVAHKVLASAEATMNTYIGATRALKAFDPPLNFIFAALTIAQGLRSVAQINNVEFAQGGQVPRKLRYDNGGYVNIGGRSHAQGGTKFWGEDGTFFEAEKDEGLFIMKKAANKEYLSRLNQKHGGRSWSSKTWYAAQGGQIEARDLANRSRNNDNVARLLVSAITNMPRPVVFVEDIRNGVNNAIETEVRSAPM